MRKSRYADSQILAILKQNENGLAVPELCRLASIRPAVLTEMLALLAATSCVKYSRNFIYNLICLPIM